MELPKKKYKIIYADPPYYFKSYSKKGEGRSATQHYNCMEFNHIHASLSVKGSSLNILCLKIPLAILTYPPFIRSFQRGANSR